MPFVGKLVEFKDSKGRVAGRVGPTYLYPKEAAAALLAAGFESADAITALAVMKEESWLSPDAEGDLLIQDDTWGPSVGVMQIRSREPEHGRGTGRDATVLKSVPRNLTEAKNLHDASGFKPWSAYTRIDKATRRPVYEKHLPWAESVVLSVRMTPKEVETLPTSQNGWPASSSPGTIGVRPFVVGGASFPGGVKSGDVATVLRYVAEQFHVRVEPLHAGWCWGYANRSIRGSGTTSNHASATAIDCNAPDHPLGKRGTFSAAQVKEIRAILAEVDGVVRWGGDYGGRADEMHFEINANAARVAAVAARLSGKEEYVPTKEEWDALVQDVSDIKTYLGSKDPAKAGAAVGRGSILSDVDWKVKEAERGNFDHKTGAKDPSPGDA